MPRAAFLVVYLCYGVHEMLKSRRVGRRIIRRDFSFASQDGMAGPGPDHQGPSHRRRLNGAPAAAAVSRLWIEGPRHRRATAFGLRRGPPHRRWTDAGPVWGRKPGAFSLIRASCPRARLDLRSDHLQCGLNWLPGMNFKGINRTHGGRFGWPEIRALPLGFEATAGA